MPTIPQTAPRSGDEQQQVREWVYPLLAGDPALAALLTAADDPADGLTAADHIWPDQAPAEVERRWLVYTPDAAFPVQPVGPYQRLLVPVPLNVRVITRLDDHGGDWAYKAARRMDTLLQGNHNATVDDGGMILTVQRTTALDYPETAGGIRYRHVGGIYTVAVN